MERTSTSAFDSEIDMTFTFSTDMDASFLFS